MDLDIPSIAARAARQALANPDGQPGASAGNAGPAPRVWVHSVGARPGGAASPSSGPGAARSWVTETCLQDWPDGATVDLPHDARITPLAQEVADKRGLRLRRGAVEGHEFGFGGAQPPRIALGSDHGGFALKQHIKQTLRELGYRVADVGTRDERASDYPDSALQVAQQVADGRALFGIAVDGAGIGSTMAANKVPGVLAANCWDERTANNAREHNHANVLCLGAGHLDRSDADRIVRVFLETPVGPGRHARRVDKIHAVDRTYRKVAPQASWVDPA